MGMRDALKSQDLAEFINQNPHIEMDVTLRRNTHPYVSAVFINGFTKDVPLRKVPKDDIMYEIERLN